MDVAAREAAMYVLVAQEFVAGISKFIAAAV